MQGLASFGAVQLGVSGPPPSEISGNAVVSSAVRAAVSLRSARRTGA
jgi:hypothetical protein